MSTSSNYGDVHPGVISSELVTVPDPVIAKIRAALALHPEFDDAMEDFPFEEFVQTKLPEFRVLGATLLREADQSQRFAVVKGLPFVNYELPVCKFLFLALASCIGRAQRTYEYSNRLVWEVSPWAKLPPSHSPTVTQHSDAAEPHTDSSFKENPERYVALLAVRPARSGGVSILVDGATLLQGLRRHCKGDALQVLSSSRFAFRRPTVFTRSQQEDLAEWIEAPVISRSKAIRYRHDVILKGFECAPDTGTRENRRAIQVFRRIVEQAPKRIIRLDVGDLLLVDNHYALHGRTAFEDKKRLLLRIRMDNY